MSRVEEEDRSQEKLCVTVTPVEGWWEDLLGKIAANRADTKSAPIECVHFKRGANNESIFQIPEPAVQTTYDFSGIEFYTDSKHAELELRRRRLPDGVILKIPAKVQFRGVRGISGPIFIRYGDQKPEDIHSELRELVLDWLDLELNFLLHKFRFHFPV